MNNPTSRFKPLHPLEITLFASMCVRLFFLLEKNVINVGACAVRSLYIYCRGQYLLSILKQRHGRLYTICQGVNTWCTSLPERYAKDNIRLGVI